MPPQKNASKAAKPKQKINVVDLYPAIKNKKLLDPVCRRDFLKAFCGRREYHGGDKDNIRNCAFCLLIELDPHTFEPCKGAF